jgi:hypothetical protein
VDVGEVGVDPGIDGADVEVRGKAAMGDDRCAREVRGESLDEDPGLGHQRNLCEFESLHAGGSYHRRLTAVESRELRRREPAREDCAPNPDVEGGGQGVLWEDVAIW